MTRTTPPKKTNLERYRVGTLEKGLNILELLEKGSKQLNIQEIALATRIQRGAVFRLLCTLERRGLVQRLENKKYRSTMRRRRLLIGYCGPLRGSSFRSAVASSLEAAAGDSGLDLMMVNNSLRDAEQCMQNARQLVEAKVDLAILFEPIESIGHTLADHFFHAGIPFITVEIPLQGGVYFGGNNYRAGKLAGQALAEFAGTEWNGRFDRVVLVGSSLVGTNVLARLTGVIEGLRSKFGSIDESRVIRLDGRSDLDTSRREVGAMLSALPEGTRLLIAGFNDPTALGALQAVRAAGREDDVAIVSQNASEETRQELRNRSRLIASVAFFPERYGAKLMQLSQSLLNHEPVPPAVYTEHVVLDHNNVNTYYKAR